MTRDEKKFSKVRIDLDQKNVEEIVKHMNESPERFLAHSWEDEADLDAKLVKSLREKNKGTSTGTGDDTTCSDEVLWNRIEAEIAQRQRSAGEAVPSSMEDMRAKLAEREQSRKSFSRRKPLLGLAGLAVAAGFALVVLVPRFMEPSESTLKGPETSVIVDCRLSLLGKKHELSLLASASKGELAVPADAALLFAAQCRAKGTLNILVRGAGGEELFFGPLSVEPSTAIKPLSTALGKSVGIFTPAKGDKLAVVWSESVSPVEENDLRRAMTSLATTGKVPADFSTKGVALRVVQMIAEPSAGDF